MNYIANGLVPRLLRGRGKEPGTHCSYMCLITPTFRILFMYTCTSVYGNVMDRSCCRNRVLPKNNSRHDGGVVWARSMATSKVFAFFLPTSKKSLCWRFVGPTCLKYTGESTGETAKHALRFGAFVNPWHMRQRVTVVVLCVCVCVCLSVCLLPC